MELFWVDAGAPGRAAVATRPRGGMFLEDDLRRLRDDGVDVLVSALSSKDIRDLSLEDEARAAAAVGLHFVHLPIPNLLTPSLAEVLPALRELASALLAGRHVAAHCFAGIGRSPLIVASLLALLGIEQEEAWGRLRAARGVQVPDTTVQQAWIAELLPHRLRAPVPSASLD